eukprot:12902069-Prorocentrum_lima.AAC.1
MLNKITVAFLATAVRQQVKGVHAINVSRVETVFLIYRGRWPSTLRSCEREHFGGTTWDDQWSQ